MPPRTTIHLVPQFHYDIEYLLPREPYLEVSFENLLEAHRLLSSDPQYTYLVEQTFLLEQFLREYPSLTAELRKYIAEGREEAANIESQTDKEAATIIAEARKQSEILKGQGDKQSMTIYAEAYNKDTGYFEFINSLEACKELVKKNSTLVLSTDSEVLKYLKYKGPEQDK